MEAFVERHHVTDLLLAIPSASRKDRNDALERLRPLSVRIRTLPGLAELVRGKVDLTDDLHDLDIVDFVGKRNCRSR